MRQHSKTCPLPAFAIWFFFFLIWKLGKQSWLTPRRRWEGELGWYAVFAIQELIKETGLYLGKQFHISTAGNLKTQIENGEQNCILVEKDFFLLFVNSTLFCNQQIMHLRRASRDQTLRLPSDFVNNALEQDCIITRDSKNSHFLI